MKDNPAESEQTFNAAYFIAKFEAIPEEKWTTEQYHDGGRSCAYGHCGVESSPDDTPEGRALNFLSIQSYKQSRSSVTIVNDGDAKGYQQETPKQRVLAWLRDAQEAGL